MGKARVEFSVGIFVVVGIAVLAYMIFSIGGLRFQREGYEVKVQFAFTSGVDAGAPVRLAGIRVGDVKTVKIVPNEKEDRYLVELILFIQKGVTIEDDAKFAINTLGMFGEKYVEITPGSLSAKPIAPGVIMRGDDPALFENFAAEIQGLAGKFSRVADQISDIVKRFDDKEAIENLKTALKESKYLVEDLRTMAKDADKMFVNASNRIDDFFGDKESMDNLKAAFKNSKFLVEDFRSVAKNANSVITNVNDIVSHVKTGEGTIGGLLYKNTIYQNLEDFTADIKRNPWKLMKRGSQGAEIERDMSKRSSFGPNAEVD